MTDAQETDLGRADEVVDRFGGESEDAPGAGDAVAQRDLPRAVEGQLRGVQMLVCPPDLVDALRFASRAANYRAASDLVTAEALRFVGPQSLSRSRWQFPFGARRPKRLWGRFQNSLATMEFERADRIALGVIVVDHSAEAVAQWLDFLGRAPSFAGVPVHFSGVSLGGDDTDLRPDIVTTSPDDGPRRLDSVLLGRGEALLVAASLSPDAVVPGGMLAEMVPGIRLKETVDRPVVLVSATDEAEADEHAALVARYHESPAVRVQAETASAGGQFDEKYLVAEGVPVRPTYIVVSPRGHDQEKQARERTLDLAIAVDSALIPTDDSVVSRTWLVPARREGDQMGSAPVMNITGQVTRSQVPASSRGSVDMTSALESLVKLITANVASFERRGQLVARPLVVFIMATAKLSGALCLSHYRRLESLADIGWILTDPSADPPSLAIDSTRVVEDNEDVVAELLAALNLPLRTD